ncbi:MAG: hypothetical protein IPN71_06395 [Fibrobacteres bacterium]|jgi:Ca-activated chloride channel family protein|nr:hypothetical protein [Fibrobacterota bacterium]
MLTVLVAIGSLCGWAAGARDNRAGLTAWKEGDTAKALKRLERAARDTSDPRFSYNLGTVRAMAGAKNADTAFAQALERTRNPAERAKILYNRGTDRLQSAQAGGACPNPAIDDLRESLKLRPGWKEAARNLELALRLRKQQEDQKKQDDKDKKKDDKKDQKDQKNKEDKDDSKKEKDDKSAQKPSDPKPDQMDKNDAERLMNAAQAKENENMKKPAMPAQGVGHGPDW